MVRHGYSGRRKAERRSKTEAKRHKRWERSARKIQRGWRTHAFRSRFEACVREKRAAIACEYAGPGVFWHAWSEENIQGLQNQWTIAQSR